MSHIISMSPLIIYNWYLRQNQQMKFLKPIPRIIFLTNESAYSVLRIVWQKHPNKLPDLSPSTASLNQASQLQPGMAYLRTGKVGLRSRPTGRAAYLTTPV